MQGQKILVVDDNPIERRWIVRQVLELSLEAIEAADLTKGVEFVNKNKPDAIVTDLNLGSENGLDFAEYLRGNNINTPIIVCTGEYLGTPIERLDKAVSEGRINVYGSKANINSLLRRAGLKW